MTSALRKMSESFRTQLCPDGEDRCSKEDWYLPEHEIRKEAKEVLSPSGRFKLLIRYYSTGKGTWNVSRGTIYRVSDGEEVADIKRNYSHFRPNFMTKDDQEYLFSGRHYMAQTLVNLDTGEEWDHYEDGFCWVKAELAPDEKTLVVEGCYWAAPFETRFFDFSNPSEGWPEIPIIKKEEYEKYKDRLEDAAHAFVPHDDLEPEFNEDGTITIFRSLEIYIPNGKEEHEFTEEEVNALGEAFDDEDNWDCQTEQQATLRRRGGYLVIEDVKNLKEGERNP